MKPFPCNPKRPATAAAAALVSLCVSSQTPAAEPLHLPGQPLAAAGKVNDFLTAPDVQGTNIWNPVLNSWDTGNFEASTLRPGLTESTLPIAIKVAREHLKMAERPEINDRFWMISTRSLTSSTCNMDLDSPEFRVHRLDCRGRLTPTTLDEYLGALTPERQVVVYVHGNRMASNQIVNRSFSVYRKIANCVENRPVDWVIWSWPSSKQGILVHDARRKAARTDAQGLYLGWLLQRQVKQTESTKMIGFSFGSRVITGALHSLAGGKLGGRILPGPPTTGATVDVGLVAPAIDTNWLSEKGYHAKATQNLDHLALLYNRRDAVLKRYWRLNKVRGRAALGYTGPRSFAPRADGTDLPIVARDYSAYIGPRHDELGYYTKSRLAANIMADLINDSDDNESQ